MKIENINKNESIFYLYRKIKVLFEKSVKGHAINYIFDAFFLYRFTGSHYYEEVIRKEAIKWLTLKWWNVTAADADAICEATESNSNAAASNFLHDFQVQKYL